MERDPQKSGDDREEYRPVPELAVEQQGDRGHQGPLERLPPPRRFHLEYREPGPPQNRDREEHPELNGHVYAIH